MKKTLKKLRFWLIKKLGGCTCEIDGRFSAEKLSTVTLNVQVRIDDYMLRRMVQYKEDTQSFICKELASQLAEAILTEKDLYELQTTYDYQTASHIYRAKMVIMGE